MFTTNMLVWLVKWVLLFTVFHGHILADKNKSHVKVEKAPNFLIIIADDLGWSDVSPFGSEINTPNLQKLANKGTRFTDFHTAAACSPSRAMLLSGTDHHIAGIGQMPDLMARFPNIWSGRDGYEGYINDRVVTLPEILRDAGYFTTMSGKWHLGSTVNRWPVSRGFQDSFALLNGGANHYIYPPYPQLLQPVFVRNSQKVNLTTLQDFYSSDYFTDYLINSLKSNDETDKKPFFAYLPFSAPHWPLQAPADVVANYSGMYNDGPDALRQKRLKKQRKLGLLSPDVVPSPVFTDLPEWDALTPSEKAFSAKSMEVYAAMVERMDFGIGRVIDYLKESKQYHNTFILFLSDNGADGMNMVNLSKVIPPQVLRFINNSYENIGNKESMVLYEARWAQASTAPSRMSKGYATEGGIRCPAIVHYPKFDQSLEISHEFATIMDILPTVLELANISHPGTTYRNHTVAKVKGKSWVPYLLNDDTQIHHIYDQQDFTGWELYGQRAIRRRNYKAVLMPNETNTAQWELYDLTQDKGELVNLANEQPSVLNELIQAWNAYANETGIYLPQNAWAIRYPTDLLGFFGTLNGTGQSSSTTTTTRQTTTV